MNQRQLNMVTGAIDGITQARAELAGPGARRKILQIMRDYIASDEQISMPLSLASYLACYVIAWREIGSPDPLTDSPDVE